MTEKVYIKKEKETLKVIPLLKKKLKIKILQKNRTLFIKGNPIDEYEAQKIFDAINFGFSAKKSLKLLDENYQFITIKIKSQTKRKVKDIKSRLIGREGKTKRTIENISGCDIIINEKENAVGILGQTEDVNNVLTAITSLIKGSREANIYAFLEKMNRLKTLDYDLGLKQEKQKPQKDNA